MADLKDRNPFEVFAEWFEEARASEPNDPNAVALATTGADGQPSVRMVLLKDHDRATGFTFYTNLESNKGRALHENPKAAMLFHWKTLRRQVRIEGPVEPVPAEDADAYFASRPRGSQIGAWASDQSRPLEDRFALEKRVARFTAKFNVGTVPRPPHWSGFVIVPTRIELWREGNFRLHDRAVFLRDRPADPWRFERLFP